MAEFLQNSLIFQLFNKNVIPVGIFKSNLYFIEDEFIHFLIS